MTKDEQISSLQSKIDRQAAHLDKIERTVASQRFYLNILDKAGRNLTKEEYEIAKAGLAKGNGQLAERIDLELVNA